MLDLDTIENLPDMPEKKTNEDSSSSSSTSDDKSSATNREQELKRKLAATRDMKMLMAHEDLDELADDAIEAFNMMPGRLNTEMFDTTDIFGDLEDLGLDDLW